MPSAAKPVFRADHVGSLLRPPEVLAARRDAAAGRLRADELRRIEDDAIRDAVARQEAIGLAVVTDGELRRESFLADFYAGISGLEPQAVQQEWNRDGSAASFVLTGFTVTAKLRLEETIFGDDFSFVRRAATRATPKVAIPAPSILHRRWGRNLVGTGVYDDMAAALADFTAAYAEEIRRLGALGCTYLQLDDTSFATLCDPKHRDAAAEVSDDPDALHKTYIKLINDAVRDRPEGMAVAVHTCRGNHRSSWFASGGYDFVAEALFGELDADIFLLEYDDERSGGFEPLRFVPKGKTVVLGLVSSKHAALESKDALKRRIDEAAKFVPIEQLALSPQCGFASTLEGNLLTVDDQYAKLRLVAETAREVWG